MSARRLRLDLTKRAQRDVRGIQLFTRRRWGAEQASAYETAFDRAFETLRDYPRIGRVRDELRAGLFSFAVERHVLYYRIGDDEIVVVRVLHASQDPAAVFREDRSS